MDEETGKELGKNEAGEILIKCEMIMNGYHKNPEATKDGFSEDGWWRTGKGLHMLFGNSNERFTKNTIYKSTKLSKVLDMKQVNVAFLFLGKVWS